MRMFTGRRARYATAATTILVGLAAFAPAASATPIPFTADATCAGDVTVAYTVPASLVDQHGAVVSVDVWGAGHQPAGATVPVGVQLHFTDGHVQATDPTSVQVPTGCEVTTVATTEPPLVTTTTDDTDISLGTPPTTARCRFEIDCPATTTVTLGGRVIPSSRPTVPLTERTSPTADACASPAACLPRTGAGGTGTVAALAALLLVAGVALGVAGRRRPDRPVS